MVMKMVWSKAIISNVRYTPANAEKNYPARVNLKVTGDNGDFSCELANGTQQDLERLRNLSLEPVAIESDFTVRSFGNNQFFSLNDPVIRRIIPQTASKEVSEPVKS